MSLNLWAHSTSGGVCFGRKSNPTLMQETFPNILCHGRASFSAMGGHLCALPWIQPKLLFSYYCPFLPTYETIIDFETLF